MDTKIAKASAESSYNPAVGGGGGITYGTDRDARQKF